MEEQIIQKKQDLTYLSWSKVRNSSGTAGSFLKAYSDINGEKIYYKLSDYDSFRGIVGHECVNEIIVDRLLDILGIEHLKYQLIHADVDIDSEIHTTYLCASKDFKKIGESKLSLDSFYQIERIEGETPLEFCIRQGWEEYIYQMLIVDFLILNRDRHGANVEVLRNPKKKEIRLAPLFDHGLSFFCRCHDMEKVAAIDVMEDRQIQCFVGGRSAADNLKLISKDKMPKVQKLKETDREYLFAGIDEIMPEIWCNKVWEMIWKRWKYYESFCNQR